MRFGTIRAARKPARFFGTRIEGPLALFGFEARVGLVDHEDAAFAAHQLAIAMATF
jgi:hypothetical protein